MSKRLNIGILMQGGKKWTGGVYYTHNIVKSLRYLSNEERPGVKLFVAKATPKEQYEELLDEFTTPCPVNLANPVSLYEKVSAKLLGGLLQQRFTSHVEKHQVEVLFPLQVVPERKLPVKWIGWIPDFQHVHLVDMFSPVEREQRTANYRALAQAADLMVFSSRAVLDDFDKVLPEHAKKQILRFCAVIDDSVFQVDGEEVRARYGLPDRFLFLTNQFWKHKDHLTAFKAVKLLRDEGFDIKLYCSGSLDDYRNPGHSGVLRRYIDDNELRGHIILLGFLPRSDQLQIMRLATALVQPTLFEGWGTVIEEGKSLGKVMFVSDIQVNKEQNAEHAIYFKRGTAEDLAAKIEAAWGGLGAGPDLSEEEKVRTQNKHRFEQFARVFMGTIHKVLEQEN